MTQTGWRQHIIHTRSVGIALTAGSTPLLKLAYAHVQGTNDTAPQQLSDDCQFMLDANLVISTHRLCREVVPRVAWSEGVQQVAGFHASKGPRLRRLVPTARLRSYWITFLLKISISRYRYISSSGSFLFHIRKYVDQDSYHHYTKSHSVTFTYFCQKYQTTAFFQRKTRKLITEFIIIGLRTYATLRICEMLSYNFYCYYIINDARVASVDWLVGLYNLEPAIVLYLLTVSTM